MSGVCARRHDFGKYAACRATDACCAMQRRQDIDIHLRRIYIGAQQYRIADGKLACSRLSVRAHA